MGLASIARTADRSSDARNVSPMQRYYVNTSRKAGQFVRFSQVLARASVGRFKSFPVQEDLHRLTIMRYVHRNPLVPVWLNALSTGDTAASGRRSTVRKTNGNCCASGQWIARGTGWPK